MGFPGCETPRRRIFPVEGARLDRPLNVKRRGSGELEGKGGDLSLGRPLLPVQLEAPAYEQRDCRGPVMTAIRILIAANILAMSRGIAEKATCAERIMEEKDVLW